MNRTRTQAAPATPATPSGVYREVGRLQIDLDGDGLTLSGGGLPLQRYTVDDAVSLYMFFHSPHVPAVIAQLDAAQQQRTADSIAASMEPPRLTVWRRSRRRLIEKWLKIKFFWALWRKHP